jgi:hypothetical protein
VYKLFIATLNVVMLSFMVGSVVALVKGLTVTAKESTQRPPPGSVLEDGPKVEKVSKSSRR